MISWQITGPRSTPSVAAEISTQNVQGMLDDLVNRLKSQSVFFRSFIQNKSEIIASTKKALLSQFNFVLNCKQNQLINVLQRLDDNCPAKILQKGFSLVLKDDKTVCANDVKKGDKLNITFKDGCISAVVESVEVK